MEKIPNTILLALGFHYFSLNYLKEGIPRFINVTDKLELAIEPEDNSQLITDFEGEKVRKRLKHISEKKARQYNFCASMWQALDVDSISLLLFGLTLLSCFIVLNLFSDPGLPTPLLSCPLIPVMLCHSRLPTLLLSLLSMPALLSCPTMLALSSLLIPALFSSFILISASCFMLDLAPTWFISPVVKIFKQALSNESLSRQSASSSPLELYCPFSILDPLSKKSNCKRLFDTTFINSRPLAANHVIIKIDLSFEQCGCPA